MEETSKITTKTYYVCGKCQKKLETMSLGSSGDVFNMFASSKTALYCDNKECDHYGMLTVVGIKREE